MQLSRHRARRRRTHAAPPRETACEALTGWRRNTTNNNNSEAPEDNNSERRLMPGRSNDLISSLQFFIINPNIDSVLYRYLFELEDVFVAGVYI